MASSKLTLGSTFVSNSMFFKTPQPRLLFFTNLIYPNQPVFPSTQCFSQDPKTMMRISTKKTSYESMKDLVSGEMMQEKQTGSKLKEVEEMINESSEWFVPMLLILVILWRHDMEALWAASGCIPNIWLSITLKNMLKQERPFPRIQEGPGMPSSHAQIIFYIFNFVLLTIVQFLGISRAAMVYGVLTFVFGSYLSWLRVSNGFHTFSQVLVGAAIGSLFAFLWFRAWDAFVFQAMVSLFWIQILIVLGSMLTFICFLCLMINKPTSLSF